MSIALASEICLAAGFLLGGLSLLARVYSEELEPVERAGYVLAGAGMLVASVLLHASPKLTAG